MRQLLESVLYGVPDERRSRVAERAAELAGPVFDTTTAIEALAGVVR